MRTALLPVVLLLPGVGMQPSPGDGDPATAARVTAGWETAVGFHAPGSQLAVACTALRASGAEYYSIELVTTKRVPGSAGATGAAAVSFMGSPFGITLSANGSYVYNLDLRIERLAPAQEGAYVVWATTPDLDRVELLGRLEDDHRLSGQVTWNKFLVVVSLEPDPQRLGSKWSGPIVLRGMSRSGMMHTMAGHGPFEQENCASFGYN